jgi:hypothetical protein
MRGKNINYLRKEYKKVDFLLFKSTVANKRRR